MFTRYLMWLLPVFLFSGCATSFMGSSKVEQGPVGCEAKCESWGMELVGMIALGEYSDGCVCKKKGAKLSMQEVGEAIILSSAGSGGGAVATAMQMRRAAAAGQQSQMGH